MERSLAFDLHIMLCLPASPHLYISSDKIRALTEGYERDTVLLLGGKGKYHICIARFLKLEHAETRRGERCSTPRGQSHSQTPPSKLWSLDSCWNPKRWQKEIWTKVTGKASPAHPVVWRGKHCCVWFDCCSLLIACGHACQEHLMYQRCATYYHIPMTR